MGACSHWTVWHCVTGPGGPRRHCRQGPRRRCRQDGAAGRDPEGAAGRNPGHRRRPTGWGPWRRRQRGTPQRDVASWELGGAGQENPRRPGPQRETKHSQVTAAQRERNEDHQESKLRIRRQALSGWEFRWVQDGWIIRSRFGVVMVRTQMQSSNIKEGRKPEY